RFLRYISTLDLLVFVPNLAAVEVAGAVSRTRGNPEAAQNFALALLNLPNVTEVPSMRRSQDKPRSWLPAGACAGPTRCTLLWPPKKAARLSR
ncbi:MAG TPA: hypothetical protein VEG34_06125, partial [Thermoanaerobaculia bacterium]|nr:hypothetical protein [Thermoanaerobaculia bacterium]